MNFPSIVSKFSSAFKKKSYIRIKCWKNTNMELYAVECGYKNYDLVKFWDGKALGGNPNHKEHTKAHWKITF